MNPIRTSLYLAMAIACCLLLSAMSKAQTVSKSPNDTPVVDVDRSLGPFLRQAEPTPTRLGLAGNSIGQLIRSRFTSIELVSADGARADNLTLAKQDNEGGVSDALSPFQDDVEWEAVDQDQDDDQTRKRASDDRTDQSKNGNDGGRNPEGDDDQDEDETKRSASRSARIAELMKPISKIEVVAVASGAAPEGYAELQLANQPVIAIGSLGISPIAPCRDTRCFMHRPLIYEQPNLERCGQSYGCCQNAVSAARFFCTTMLLPYHLGRTPCSCLVSGGRDCRTCETYPQRGSRFKIGRWNTDSCEPNRRGLIQQAAAVAGFTFLLL